MSGRSCPTCTVTLTENTRFCPNCGQVLLQTGDTISLTQSSPQNSSMELTPPPQLHSGHPLASQQVYTPQPVQPPPHVQPQSIAPLVNANSQTVNQAGSATIVPVKQKNVLVAFLLTFLFGPLGLLYVNVGGALIFFVVTVVLSILTAGGFAFLAWFTSMVWGTVAASNYNKRTL